MKFGTGIRLADVINRDIFLQSVKGLRIGGVKFRRSPLSPLNQCGANALLWRRSNNHQHRYGYSHIYKFLEQEVQYLVAGAGAGHFHWHWICSYISAV